MAGTLAPLKKAKNPISFSSKEKVPKADEVRGVGVKSRKYIIQ